MTFYIEFRVFSTEVCFYLYVYEISDGQKVLEITLQVTRGHEVDSEVCEIDKPFQNYLKKIYVPYIIVFIKFA